MFGGGCCGGVVVEGSTAPGVLGGGVMGGAGVLNGRVWIWGTSRPGRMGALNCGRRGACRTILLLQPP